jgi:hypothetical protein
VLTVRDGNIVYERTPAPVETSDTQIYDTLIKRGRLADDEVDVALTGGRIARVGRRLPASHARVVIEAEGYDVRQLNGAAGLCGETAAFSAGPLEGRSADLALIESVGPERRCVLAIRGGRVVFDSVGLSIADVSRAGPYSNFK